MGQPAAAQSDPVLKVGISPFSPFVMLSEQEPIGLAIDMWQALSRDLEISYEYVEYKGVADKLKRLQEGRIDIAIGGISITEDREKIAMFHHDYIPGVFEGMYWSASPLNGWAVEGGVEARSVDVLEYWSAGVLDI